MLVDEDGLTVEIMDHRGIVLLDVSGQLAGDQARALPEALDDHDGAITSLTVGLDGVSCIDLRGVEAIFDALDSAERRRIPMQVIGASGQVRRTLETSDLEGALGIVG